MFKLSLEVNGNLEMFSHLEEQEEYKNNDEKDDIIVLIIVSCMILEETGIVKFNVQGFGEDYWPVDVGTDLSTVLEQISEAIYAISSEHYPFYLEFYEQGLERTIVFEKENKLIRAICYSNTSWVPNPKTILMNQEYVLEQLCTLKHSFKETVKKVCPNLYSNEVFLNW